MKSFCSSLNVMAMAVAKSLPQSIATEVPPSVGSLNKDYVSRTVRMKQLLFENQRKSTPKSPVVIDGSGGSVTERVNKFKESTQQPRETERRISIDGAPPLDSLKKAFENRETSGLESPASQVVTNKIGERSQSIKDLKNVFSNGGEITRTSGRRSPSPIERSQSIEELKNVFSNGGEITRTSGRRSPSPIKKSRSIKDLVGVFSANRARTSDEKRPLQIDGIDNPIVSERKQMFTKPKETEEVNLRRVTLNEIASNPNRIDPRTGEVLQFGEVETDVAEMVSANDLPESAPVEPTTHSSTAFNPETVRGSVTALESESAVDSETVYSSETAPDVGHTAASSLLTTDLEQHVHTDEANPTAAAVTISPRSSLQRQHSSGSTRSSQEVGVKHDNDNEPPKRTRKQRQKDRRKSRKKSLVFSAL